jgi:ribonuclease HII
VDHSIIDDINILQAALVAMTQAVEGLGAKGQPADHLLIDGNK